jgi:alcohol dehydrogenase YqhD (iron-dependent ADH family)
MCGEGGIDHGAIFEITEDEFRFGMNRSAMPLLEVIEYDYLITSPDQFRDNGAADIASPACDKYFHDFTF